MTRSWLTFALVAAIGAGGTGAFSYAAKSAEGGPFVGSWVGTWEGDGGGKFDMKFEQGSDGGVTGEVVVGTDVGDYTTKFDSLSFGGSKMQGRYEYPLDTQGEIVIEGDFEAGKALGTWALVAKGSNDVAFNGTWNVRKD